MEGRKYHFTPKDSTGEKASPWKRLFGGSKKDGKKDPKGVKGPGSRDDPEKKITVSKLRSESYLKPLRFLLWIMLIVIAVRGAATFMRPDQVSIMRQTTETFMTSFSEAQAMNLEVGAYAQTFAKEYLTYAPGGEAEYAVRLKLFAPKVYYGDSESLKSSSSCTYASAYRIEKYDLDQYDVHVLAKVTYQTPQVSADGQTITQVSAMKDVYLKVPVRWSSKGCVVTDFPAFIAGPTPIEYPNKSFNGSMAMEDENRAVEKAMTDFFSVYYGDSQSRVDYYLQSPELGEQIKAMYGRYTFERIDSLETYKDPGSEGDFIAIAKIRVQDSGTTFLQRYSIYLTHKDGRYYIKGLDNRAVDLKSNTNSKETIK